MLACFSSRTTIRRRGATRSSADVICTERQHALSRISRHQRLSLPLASLTTTCTSRALSAPIRRTLHELTRSLLHTVAAVCVSCSSVAGCSSSSSSSSSTSGHYFSARRPCIPLAQDTILWARARRTSVSRVLYKGGARHSRRIRPLFHHSVTSTHVGFLREGRY